jgi:hypothetical protein
MGQVHSNENVSHSQSFKENMKGKAHFDKNVNHSRSQANFDGNVMSRIRRTIKTKATKKGLSLSFKQGTKQDYVIQKQKHKS